MPAVRCPSRGMWRTAPYDSSACLHSCSNLHTAANVHTNSCSNADRQSSRGSASRVHASTDQHANACRTSNHPDTGTRSGTPIGCYATGHSNTYTGYRVHVGSGQHPDAGIHDCQRLTRGRSDCYAVGNGLRVHH